MRIAIDISQIVYEGTGVATYTDQLVRSLLEVDPHNDYILFGISLRKLKFLKDYFFKLNLLHKNLTSKFLYIPPTIGEFLWNRLHIFAVDNFLGKVDIFHSSDWIQPPVNAVKITTVHDLFVHEYPDISHPYIVETQKQRLKWVKKECGMILTDSAFTKNQLIKILGIDSTNIEVVYPGIANKFKPQNAEDMRRIKQKYSLYDDYVLSVGTLEPRKNIKTVLEAFERFQKHPLIAARNKPLSLVIVGKFGWGEKVINTKYVKTLGFVDENDLPALYSGAMFFIYPSLYEGFGFPILEAMACNCPVITSTRGSLRELVADAALIVDPQAVDDIALKMTQLVVDVDLRSALIKRGQKNAERFDWKKTAREVLAIYNKMINRDL